VQVELPYYQELQVELEEREPFNCGLRRCFMRARRCYLLSFWENVWQNCTAKK